MANKTLPLIFAVTSLMFLTSCSTLSNLHIFGKNSKAVDKQADKIQQVEDKQSQNDKLRLKDMTVMAMGTDYALEQVTNKSREVQVARDINQRVISEGGYDPTVKEITDMKLLIDNLIATNKDGIEALKVRDSQIEALQQDSKRLSDQKDKEIDKFQTLASQTAQKADVAQGQLSQYTSYWGLGGVFLGLKSFLKHILWAGAIGLVLFIVLRALSFTNPAAAAIFGIFQSVGASVIHVIESIIPSSISTLSDAKNDVLKVSNFVNNVAKVSSPPTPSVAPAPVVPAPIVAPLVQHTGSAIIGTVLTGSLPVSGSVTH